MKTISLKFQKIIVWIPYMNVSIPFLWIYNIWVQKRGRIVFKKSLNRAFWTAFPLFILESVIVHFWGNVQLVVDISHALAQYVTPLAMGLVLINYQEKTDNLQ